MATQSTQPGAGSPTKKPRRALLGKKLGMTQIFTESGERVPVTVLKVGPCTVLQVKTLERDGYSALQVGFDETPKPRKYPQQAYLDSHGLPGTKYVKEVPYPAVQLLAGALKAAGAASESAAELAAAAPSEEPAPEAETSDAEAAETEATEAEAGTAEEGSGEEVEVAPGVRVCVTLFKDVRHVDVRGVSKGRGFAGMIRRHGFNAGPKSHGSKNIRQMGSTGMHTDPGRVFPGRPMPGHMGAVNRKARNLEVVSLDETENILLVKGSVPGPRGGYVYVEESLG